MVSKERIQNRITTENIIPAKDGKKGKTNDKGSTEVEEVRSESYEDDPKTGRKIKHIKQQFYSNMILTNNL